MTPISLPVESNLLARPPSLAGRNRGPLRSQRQLAAGDVLERGWVPAGEAADQIWLRD